MQGDPISQFREGLANIREQIVEQLSQAGVAITVAGVTIIPAWCADEPIPESVAFEVEPVGRKVLRLVFSNEEVEDCWEGLDRAEVRRKLREMVDKFSIVDRKMPGQSEKQRFEEANAIVRMAFPRIHGKIVSMWGTGEGEVFLDQLIMDDRGGRQGFPPNVMGALLILQRVHFQKFGTFKKLDPWDIARIGKWKV